MAINGVVHGGRESKWGILEMSDFDAAASATGNHEKIEGPMPSVDFGLHRNNSVKFGDGRMRSVANDFVTDKGGLRVISFSDMVVRLEDMAYLLYAVCQNVSEGGAEVYEKTYTLSSSTTQPDFSANEGYFCQIGIYDTIASYHRAFTGCILRTLTLSADLTGDGLVRASGEWISGHAASTTTNFNTGTWNYNTQTYFNFFQTPTKKVGGSDVVLHGFDITINNNAVRVGSTGANGICETYALGTGEGGYEVSGNIKCKFDTNTQGMFAADIAGTTTAIQLACGTDGASGNFDFTCASCLVQDVKDDYDNAAGRALDIPFIANSSAVFTCSDANSRSW